VLVVQRFNEYQDVVLKEVNAAEVGTYLTLSHCWGQQLPLRTMRSNVAQMKSRISWDKLPETFQNAVTITRGLQQQYLWIDSLCLYLDRYQTKYRRNLRLGPLFSPRPSLVALISRVIGACPFCTKDKCYDSRLYNRQSLDEN